jgi:aryl-alcohol dehydrogenase-like predicted oxidoreductase
MKYSRLGDTGLLVSRLALGTMTFGEGATGPLASLYKVDQAGADRLVAQAIDAGVNYFNTADMYAGGRSEEMLGHALHGRRASAVIATKVGNRTGPALVDQGLSRHHILAAAEASLRRLATDWIDVYLVHRLDPYTPVEETLEALDRLVRQGKVRYVGLSNWPAWLAAKAVGIQRARGYEPFRAAEQYYSLVGRDVEHEFVPFALDAGIGLQPWSPLAGGYLSGRYTAKDPTGDGGRLAGLDFIPVDRALGERVLGVLGGIAAARGASAAQVALAWLLARPGVASVLVGASRPEQLTDNLRAVELELSAEELERLDAASRPPVQYPAWFSPLVVDGPAREALGG